jgi:hypothetical protein
MKPAWLFSVAGSLAISAAASVAGASVIGATVADASSGNYTLTSVSVNRSGAGIFTYVPSQLTGVDLTDVGATGTPLLIPSGASLPPDHVGARAALLEDGRLDTGVINPVSVAAAADFSFEVTFLSPVTNSNGEDVLVFEIGGNDTTRFWINNDRAGSSHDVAPGDFSAALLSGMPFSTVNYNNGGDIDINTLLELESETGFSAPVASSGNIHAAGLDLSDFGVAPGATVASIRFQAVSGRLDPVLIGGLPAVPEPSSLALLALVGLGTLKRPRA